MQHQEYTLQRQVCQWLSLQHKEILFLSDTIAAVKLTLPQGARNKAIQKNGFKCPDLIILQPNEKYNGLFIELKTETPFKRDGTIKKNEHLEGQLKTLQDLRNKGYFAEFCWSFYMATDLINKYLKNQL